MVRLKVVSLNCHGLCVLSCDREQRMRSIARYLCGGRFHVVCLQEVFVARDYHFVSNAVRSHLPYSHWYTNSGVVGSCGLAILSRWPLSNVHFHQFRLQGHPWMVWHGDWYAKKGVAYARLDLAHNLTVHLFNMHLHANYGYCQYQLQRYCQAYEMARYIETVCGSESQSALLVLAGDLNTYHTELGYQLVQSRLQLFNCHQICVPKCHCKKGPDAQPNLSDLTVDKIDFIFVRLPAQMIATVEVFEENGFDEDDRQLSDHLPVVVRLKTQQGDVGQSTMLDVVHNRMVVSDHKHCLEQLLHMCQAYLEGDRVRNSTFAWVANVICLLAFVVCTVFYAVNQLETALLLMLLLWVMYTITMTNMFVQDGVSKAVRYMVISLQSDLQLIRHPPPQPTLTQSNPSLLIRLQ